MADKPYLAAHLTVVNYVLA